MQHSCCMNNCSSAFNINVELHCNDGARHALNMNVELHYSGNEEQSENKFSLLFCKNCYP
jgi:hypothetical protein